MKTTEWWRTATAKPAPVEADPPAEPDPGEWWDDLYEDPAGADTFTPAVEEVTPDAVGAAWWPRRRRPSPWRPPAPPVRERTREALYDWFQRRTRKQLFVLRNASAALTGAYGYGLFTGQWDTGIQQTVLTWMVSADASSTSPATPLLLGGCVVLAAVVAGGVVDGFLSRCFRAVPALCNAIRWAVVSVPVTSAFVAVLLFTTV